MSKHADIKLLAKFHNDMDRPFPWKQKYGKPSSISYIAVSIRKL